MLLQRYSFVTFTIPVMSTARSETSYCPTLLSENGLLCSAPALLMLALLSIWPMLYFSKFREALALLSENSLCSRSGALQSALLCSQSLQ